jgi:hypothetical protein
LKGCSSILANSRFEVQLFNCASDIGGVVQMVVRRHGDIAKIEWDELQRIKNEIFGEEYSAVEFFPPKELEWHINREIRVLWVLPQSWVPPFGFHLSSAWGKNGE